MSSPTAFYDKKRQRYINVDGDSERTNAAAVHVIVELQTIVFTNHQARHLNRGEIISWV